MPRPGANAVVNYKTDDVDEALTSFGPIDVWFENLREPNLERAVTHLAMRGRIVLIAGRDARPTFPVGPFYTKDAVVRGLAMFNAPAEDQRKSAAEINRWLAKGKLRPVIGRVMKLLRGRRGPSPSGREHAEEEGRPAGQDRAGTVKIRNSEGGIRRRRGRP